MAIGRIPEPGTGIPESIIAAKGDLLTGTANDVPAVITVGANETRLVAASGEATGLKYVADTTNYAVAAKGDLLVGTAADTLAPLTVGANGTTLVADSSTATGLKWATPAAGGKVLQVVQATTTTATTIASTTAVDTTITATITPSSATSKVLVFVNMIVNGSSTNGTLQVGSNLVRGATTILSYINAAAGPKVGTMQSLGTTWTNGDLTLPLSMMFLDSPATTSATTYKVQGINTTVGATVSSIYQQNSLASVILLLEIGA